MEQKTKIAAEDGKQDLTITRKFDLPLELLFKAYALPEILEQWMGTKVLKMENKPHGSYQIETNGPDGNVAFRANGTIHDFVQNEKITRTFEMENAPFGVQLEFLEFEAVGTEKSKLSIHTVFRSVGHRDKLLAMPFAYGINMAHGRLEQIASKLK